MHWVLKREIVHWEWWVVGLMAVGSIFGVGFVFGQFSVDPPPSTSYVMQLTTRISNQEAKIETCESRLKTIAEAIHGM
jgi:hypothetical protein